MNHVFVVDSARRPLTPCRPAQTRRMLRDGKAAVLRRFPFTLILKEEKPEAAGQPLTVKLDPGSKTTGIVVTNASGRVLFAAELTHRGAAIKDALHGRSCYRRNRRSRKTRYRAARFDNRSKPEGWLPPSLQHRVDTILTWVRRFGRLAPINAAAIEHVKFDMQKMQNPEISGIKYQQGTLQGYEVREYLLDKWGRKCAYCDAENTPLEVDHIQPVSKGGSNRVSNLTLACHDCNQRKGNSPIEHFLAKKPEVLKRIQTLATTPLKDAAAVNATQNALFKALLATGLPVEPGTGSQTKFNRSRLGYPKAHWIDAACVGESGATVTLDPVTSPLKIIAMGHGKRQRCRPDRFGFPGQPAPNRKQFAGFRTGDLVRANIRAGKFAGIHTGRIAIRHRPSFQLIGFDVHPKYLTRVQQADGYAYAI
ncbi:MAG: RNA-guided endonuclease IscB [Acidiferrobacterales bacterium]